MKDRVRFQANPYGMSGRQSGVESDISCSTSVVVFTIILSVLLIIVKLIYIRRCVIVTVDIFVR